MHISVRDTNTRALYAELCRIGFDGVDVSFPTWDRREDILSAGFEESMMEKYAQIANAGLRVCQTHLTYYPGHLSPIGDGSYRAFEEYMLPILAKEIALVSKMNCGIAVIHLYFEASKENSRAGNLQLIEKLLPVLEQNHVVLAIENIYGPCYGEAHLSTAEDLLFYTDYFQSQHVNVCLDTGHAVTRKQDPIEMVEKLGGTLRALHLHSNAPERDLHLPPCFTRFLDWQKFCEALQAVGYHGPFNMEVSAPKQLNQKTAVAYYEMLYGIAEGLLGGETKSQAEEI